MLFFRSANVWGGLVLPLPRQNALIPKALEQKHEPCRNDQPREREYRRHGLHLGVFHKIRIKALAVHVRFLHRAEGGQKHEFQREQHKPSHHGEEAREDLPVRKVGSCDAQQRCAGTRMSIRVVSGIRRSLRAL